MATELFYVWRSRTPFLRALCQPTVLLDPFLGFGRPRPAPTEGGEGRFPLPQPAHPLRIEKVQQIERPGACAERAMPQRLEKGGSCLGGPAWIVVMEADVEVEFE